MTTDMEILIQNLIREGGHPRFEDKLFKEYCYTSRVILEWGGLSGIKFKCRHAVVHLVYKAYAEGCSGVPQRKFTILKASSF